MSLCVMNYGNTLKGPSTPLKVSTIQYSMMSVCVQYCAVVAHSNGTVKIKWLTVAL